MRELAFLINPISGGGVGKAVFHQLAEILDSFGMSRESWRAELTDPARLEKQIDGFLNDSRKVIAVGGDGTIGMVLDRVSHLRPDTAIGLIPLGTGNDLGRALGVFRIYNAKGLIACLRRLLKAPSNPFDLWDVSGQATMVSYLSVGMDAAILRFFDQGRKKGRIRGGALGNKLYYVLAFFSRLGVRLPEGASATLETSEGTVQIPLAGRRSLLAANIDSYAAGAHPFPGKRFDSGWMEIAIFDSLWKYVLITGGSRLLPPLSRWARKTMIRYRAKKLVITLPPQTPVQMDGEDFTDAAAGKPIVLTHAVRANLLDLRRSFYALF